MYILEPQLSTMDHVRDRHRAEQVRKKMSKSRKFRTGVWSRRNTWKRTQRHDSYSLQLLEVQYFTSHQIELLSFLIWKGFFIVFVSLYNISVIQFRKSQNLHIPNLSRVLEQAKGFPSSLLNWIVLKNETLLLFWCEQLGGVPMA